MSQLAVSISPKQSRSLVRLEKVVQKMVICWHAATFAETRDVQSSQGRWRPYAAMQKHVTMLLNFNEVAYRPQMIFGGNE